MSKNCKWLHEQLERLPLMKYPIEHEHRFYNPFGLHYLPENGIYFFYENGESWGHGGDKPRIVRIGSHKQGNFRKRIMQHYFFDDRKMNFDKSKPSDRSIFRKNIGRALLWRDGDEYVSLWEKDFTKISNRDVFGHIRDIEKEKAIESKITEIVKNRFSFRFIQIDDEAARIGKDGLEKALIGTIAGCKCCNPSDNWLGNHSPVDKIRDSGLWLVQYLNSKEINETQKEVVRKAIRKGSVKKPKELFYVASVGSDHTGVGVEIWFEERGQYDFDDNLNLKVSAYENNKIELKTCCDVTFNRSGKILKIKPNKYGDIISDQIRINLQQWILLNIEILLQHWDHDIDTVNFFRRHVKLEI
ncbi:MAG: hypothetical protein NT178_16670 [Proteobacteria bacterium]|nr:hypothetical protein [Pseudomonadota bacterium]